MSLLSSKGVSASESDAEDNAQSDAQGVTPFAEMSGTFNLDNFVLSNDDFVLSSPAFNVTGEGVIDVAQQNVDYLIEVAVAENIGGVLGNRLDKIKGQRIPIRCKGALDAPLCLPDAKRLYKNFLASRLDQKKGEFLEEKLGIKGADKLSTKDVLKGFLNKKLDEKANDDEGQERSISERGAAAGLQNDESANQQDAEAEEEPKDKLKRKLLKKLFD